VHPDDLQGCLDIYVSNFDARREFLMEYRLRHADGEFRWLLDNGIPRFDNQGLFLGYVGSCIDITDRKQGEEILRKSERKYRQLYETMAQGVVYHASDGNITSANPAAQRILSVSLDQMQGRTSLDPRWSTIREDGSGAYNPCQMNQAPASEMMKPLIFLLQFEKLSTPRVLNIASTNPVNVPAASMSRQ
jgi:PAS domain-containing protein